MEEDKDNKTDKPTLHLPKWMIDANNIQKQKISIATKRENLSRKSDKETKNYKKPRLDEADDILNFHLSKGFIAEQSEYLLKKAESVEALHLSFDLDWPQLYKSRIAKSWQIHMCIGNGECRTFDIKYLTNLPSIFIRVLNHPKVKLFGKNLISDINKIGKDYKFDVQNILTKNTLTDTDLSCKHDWNQNPDLLCKENEFLIFKGKINVYDNFYDCAAVCEQLINKADNGPIVIGFDLEWPFSYGISGKVALIQLCVPEEICYLFRSHLMTSLPKALCVLLRHKNIKFTGLNIRNDFRKLGRDFKLKVDEIIKNNVIELTEFANLKLLSSERWSLKRLVSNLFNKELSKEVRCSNWSAEELSEEQLLYAATDAYASLICYQKLNSLE